MKFLWICFWTIVRFLPVAMAFGAGLLYENGHRWQSLSIIFAAVIATFWIVALFTEGGVNAGTSSIPLIEAGFTKARRKMAKRYWRYRAISTNVTYILEATFPFLNGHLVVVQDTRYPDNIDGARRIFFTTKAALPCKIRFKIVKKDGIKQASIEGES